MKSRGYVNCRIPSGLKSCRRDSDFHQPARGCTWLAPTRFGSITYRRLDGDFAILCGLGLLVSISEQDLDSSLCSVPNSVNMPFAARGLSPGPGTIFQYVTLGLFPYSEVSPHRHLSDFGDVGRPRVWRRRYWIALGTLILLTGVSSHAQRGALTVPHALDQLTQQAT